MARVGCLGRVATHILLWNRLSDLLSQHASRTFRYSYGHLATGHLLLERGATSLALGQVMGIARRIRSEQGI
jgi:hypothetical protein